MFSISFRRPLDPKQKFSLGTIVLGTATDGFHASFDYWQPSDYEKQWREAVKLIVNGAEKAALITEMPPPSKANFVRWWPMWRFQDAVRIHEQILFMDQLNTPFTLEDPYAHVDNYHEFNEEGERLSEWTVPLQDFVEFLQNA